MILLQLLIFVVCHPFFKIRFDGNEIKTDETIRTLAQKWQPSRRPHSEERNAKAVDTDMIVVSCVVSFKNLTPIKKKSYLCIPVFSHLCFLPSLNPVTVKRPQRRSM